MNFMLPGRLHVIWHRRRLFYLTVWIFGRRFHWSRPASVFEWHYEEPK